MPYRERVEIRVTELRIGMVIVEGGSRHIPVQRLEPCTQRRKVHVNERHCYDYAGYVTILAEE